MSTQVVLITGALTGIGRATAVAFAKKGARVVVSGRHGDKGLTLIVVTAGHHDLGAFPGERHRGGATNAGERTGNQDNLRTHSSAIPR